MDNSAYSLIVMMIERETGRERESERAKNQKDFALKIVADVLAERFKLL